MNKPFVNKPLCPVGVSLFADSAIIREEFSSLISFWPMPWQHLLRNRINALFLQACLHGFLRPDLTAMHSQLNIERRRTRPLAAVRAPTA